jgi:hypothetical protein
MTQHQLAQLNVAKMKAPLESPLMADFVAKLEEINQVADAAPGFIWRLQTEAGDATLLRPLGDEILVNMSVWSDAAALADFVYRSAHATVMRRRREWFTRLADAYMVLWWIPRGHRPTVAEAIERLDELRTRGPSARAFTFRQQFGPGGKPAFVHSLADDRCSVA